MKSKIILRSSSPRRKQALSSLNLFFSVEPLSTNEEELENEPYLEYLERVTRSKLGEISNPKDVYLSADTIVVMNNRIFPKPESAERNFEYLSILNGKTHKVCTGLCINDGNHLNFCYEETRVTFKQWTGEEIWSYIDKYKPMDKAGGYAIQEEKSPVERIEGSYWNVVGFPMKSFFTYHKLWSQFLGCYV